MKKFEKANRLIEYSTSFLTILTVSIFISGCGERSPVAKNTIDCETVEVNYNNIIYTSLCEKIAPSFDYNEALARANQHNKPIVVIFSGLACVNCRHLETNVLFNPYVQSYLLKHFIVTVLFVDERLPLSMGEYTKSKFTGKEITTTGQYNMEIQNVMTQYSSQPSISVFNQCGEFISIYNGELFSSKEFKNWLTSSIDTLRAN